MYNGPFHLYFAGRGSKNGMQLKQELGCDQLYSQLNERVHILKDIEYLKEHPGAFNLFVDSGAYSAYTQGKEIDVDDYIDFINKTGDYVTVFAQVDKIPQVIGRKPTEEELAAAPGQSWENYLYMIEKINPKYRDKILPVFHFEEDTKWLHNMLNYTFPDGEHIKYIGLAVSTVDTAAVRFAWLQMCFDIIKNSPNPDVMTHVFGCTALDVLEKFPVTSADSTTWVQAAAYGNVIINNKAWMVSDRRIKDNGNMLNQTKHQQEEFDKKLRHFGYTLEECSKNYEARQIVNIRSMQEWCRNYKCTYQNITRGELW